MATMSIHPASIALSVARAARSFGLGLPGLRSMIRRGLLPGLKQPIPGSWLQLSPRDCAGLALVSAGRAAGFRGARLKAIWSTVRDGFEESDATGFAPFLVIDPPAGSIRVFMCEAADAPRLHPPVGVLAVDLLDVEARFGSALQPPPATPAQAEAALHQAFMSLEPMQPAEAAQPASPAAVEAPQVPA
jgi:hypothetical protein